MNIEVHAMRFEDDDAKRATNPTYVSQPARKKIDPGSEVVIRAKDGIVHVTIDGEQQGFGMSLGKWDYTAVSVAYDESLGESE